MNDDTKAVQPTSAKQEPLLVRVEEAARLLGLSRSTVYTMLATSELPSIKRGAIRRIPIAALHAWVAANTQ